MRAYEFLTEEDLKASSEDFAPGHMDAIKGAMTSSEISMNNSQGSQYLQWRFGIAMAGAPDYPSPPAGPMAGDPLLSCYTDEELNIINIAAKTIGAKPFRKLSKNRSTEMSTTNKTSPITPFKGYGK